MDTIDFLLPKQYAPIIDEEGDEAWHKLIRKYVSETLWNPYYPDRKVEKGGPGSGNFGHAGLAGVHGGSSPAKSGFRASPSESTYFPKDWLSPSDESKKSIKIMKNLGGTDPKSGFTVSGSVNYNSHNNEKVTYNGYVYNKTGEKVGSVQVLYSVDLLVGEISEVMLDKQVQGTGFGKRYVEHIEDTLSEMGARELTVTATASVGGYFWAKVGYDFRSQQGRDTVVRRLKSAWMKRYPMKKMPSRARSNNVHPWEIAALVGPDGYKIGKEALLGSSWFGGKVVAGQYSHVMGIDDTGYKIGKEYYGLGQSTKGGPGSGNFGHSGLAGVHGGSSPKISFRRLTIPDAREEVYRFLDNLVSLDLLSEKVLEGVPERKPYFDISNYRRHVKYTNTIMQKNLSEKDFDAASMIFMGLQSMVGGTMPPAERQEAYGVYDSKGRLIALVNYFFGDYYDDKWMYVGSIGSFRRGAATNCLRQVFKDASKSGVGIYGDSAHYRKFSDSLKKRFNIETRNHGSKYGEVFIPAESVPKMAKLFDKIAVSKEKNQRTYSDFGEILLDLLEDSNGDL